MSPGPPWVPPEGPQIEAVLPAAPPLPQPVPQAPPSE